ncbi:HNH endonuclease [Bacillus sp. N6]|uniref:HNH endonuclease n=1 Tax=Bacillus sp. N6 TaxID=127893 RepID=UPI0040560C69
MNNKLCGVCGDIVPINEQCLCNKPNKSEASKKHISGTRRFQKLRKYILNRDNYTCQRCVIKFGRTDETIHQKLQVHHIKSWRDFPELAFEESNLVTCCKSCNLELGNKNKLDFPLQPLQKIITF